MFDFSYEKKHAVWLRVVNNMFPFQFFEVKMPSSCSPKAKAIQSCGHEQNNCRSFGDKRTSSRISRAGINRVSLKHGVQAAGCGLRAAGCGYWHIIAFLGSTRDRNMSIGKKSDMLL